MPLSSPAFFIDGWDFAETVFRWNRDGKLVISDFPSMTLITHLWWGKLWTTLLGESPMALRVSSLVSATIFAIVLGILCNGVKLSKTVTLIVLAVLMFNPMLLQFSLTFMTDVSGCTISLLLAVCLAGYARMLATPRTPVSSLIGMQLLCTLVTVAAYLLRQTAVVPFVAFLILCIGSSNHRLRRLGALPIVLGIVVPIAIYWYWIYHFNGLPLGFQKPFLDLDLLSDFKIMIVKSARIALTLAFHSWPLAVPMFFYRSNLRWRIGVVLATAIAVILLFNVPQLAGVRLYFGYVSFDGNLGYLTEIDGLKDQLVYSSIDLGQLGSIQWQSIRLLLSVFAIVTFIATVLANLRQLYTQLHLWWRSDRVPSVYSICLLSFVGQVTLLLLLSNIFDRYFLPAFTMAMVCAIPVMKYLQNADISSIQPSRHISNRVLWRLASVTCVAVASVISIGETSDWLYVWRNCWILADSLQAAGVDPREIDLGMSYYGFHVYRPQLHKLIDSGSRRLDQLDEQTRKSLLEYPPNARYSFCTLVYLNGSGEKLKVLHDITLRGFFNDFELVLVQR
jgi:hypothetical protein